MSGRGSVLVTGAGRGIGAALAAAFAAAGWRVHGTVRDLGTAADPREGVTLHRCDPTDWGSMARLARTIGEPLEVVVANAASFGDRAYWVDELDPEAMLATFGVNVVAPAFLAKLFKPHLLRGERRLLLMMSTGNASLGGNVAGEMLAYRASKSALNQVVRTIAAEWKDDGIVTVALNPGWVRTEMGGDSAPLLPHEAAAAILAFVDEPLLERFNGAFVNTDGSALPW